MGKLYRQRDSTFWWASYTGPDGRRVRTSTKLINRRDAEEWLARRLVAVAHARADQVTGRAPAEAAAGELAQHAAPSRLARVRTVADAVGVYGLPWVGRYRDRSPRYGSSAAAILREIGVVLGPRRLLSSIDASAVVAFADRVASRGSRGTRSGATVDRYLSALHVLLQAACDDGVIAGVPSFRRARRGTPTRTWVPTDAQVQRLIALAPARMCRALVLAVETGMRRGELEALTVASADVAGRRITISHAKGGEGRIVPLTPAALEVVRELLRIRQRTPTTETPWLLIDDDGARYRPAHYQWDRVVWRRLLKAAGIPDDAHARWHDLRAYTATRLHREGMDSEMVMKLLGHKSPGAHRRYVRLAADDVQRALDAVAKKRQDPVIDAPRGRRRAT